MLLCNFKSKFNTFLLTTRTIYLSVKKFPIKNKHNIKIDCYCNVTLTPYKLLKNWNYETSIKYLNHCLNYCSHTKLPPTLDIPEYLKEIVNKVVPQSEEDLEDIEELMNYMEDEVIDFLSSRAFPFEELEGSFIVLCPSCGHSDKTHDMFIDKNSGYCVCPWCCWDGRWSDLIKLIDAKEDSLTYKQLKDYLFKVKLVDDSHSDIINSSSLSKIHVSQLKGAGALISEDLTKLIFPLKGEKDEIVGFASLSLLHPKPVVVKRLLEGESAIFTGLPKPKRTLKRVVIVSSIIDALHLAKYNIQSVVLFSEPSPNILKSVTVSFKNIVLWFSDSQVPQSLLTYLSSNNINSFTVKINGNEDPLPSMTENKITRLLSDVMPILSGSIVSFQDIRSKVYERIIKKDEIFGIKWTRFSDLNNLLLGHRQGELTIFSGQTGSGKTTFMAEFSLDLCMQGVSTLWGSFEINVPRLCEILLQQFCGKPLPENYSSFKDLADQFAQIPMHFLNTHGQQPLKDVLNTLTEAVLIKGVRHVVIDNLQFMLGLHGANADWWLEQDRAVGAFRQFATSYNCHVTLIVHPRKLNPGEKLNLHSISGGARVTQEADNVIILHVRENRDGSTNLMGPKTLQIAKNRYGGTLGEMRLRFHKESLTLSSWFRNDKKDKSLESSSLSEYSEIGAHVSGLPFLSSR